MKKTLLLCMMIWSYMAAHAQATDLVIDNQTPGWLSSKINYSDQQTVENLKITGFVNPVDIKFIGQLFYKSLSGVLDMSEVNVVAEDHLGKDNYMEFSFFDVSFAGNPHYLTKLILPKSLIELKEGFGTNKFIIDTLVFDNQVSLIKSYQFTNVRHLILGENVIQINSNLMTGCDVNLESVFLPQSLKILEDHAFSMVMTTWSECNICEFPNLEYMGYMAFANRSVKPNTAILPDTIKLPKIKEYHINWLDFKEGTQIYLGENVEHVYYEPKTAYSYSDRWYATLNNISLHIAAKTPPNCTSYPVWNRDLKVYVPKGYGDVYKSHSGWKNANIIEEVLPLEKIELNYHELNLEKGDTFQLTASYVPDNADETSLVWISDNENIASVTNEGIVNANNHGAATITVSTEDGKIMDKCAVRVLSHASSVIIIPTNVYFEKLGDTKQLVVEVLPEDATDKSVRWSSSNESVCFVTDIGTAIAMGEGTAVVLALTNDGNLPATCVVTVSLKKEATGINDVRPDCDDGTLIFSHDGKLLGNGVSTLRHLTSGVYIIKKGNEFVKVKL